jgi:hypothetical protein
VSSAEGLSSIGAGPVAFSADGRTPAGARTTAHRHPVNAPLTTRTGGPLPGQASPGVGQALRLES